jgi:hypothetical protein
VAQNAGSDRYDPLPGITELPAFLYRKLAPHWKRVAQVAGAVLLLALAAGIVWGLPAITRTKDERAAVERSAQQRRHAERVRALTAEMRPLHGRGAPARGLEGSAALTTRRALAADVAAAVQHDAAARVRSGELAHRIKGVDCKRFPRGVNQPDPAADLSSRTGRYECLAITATSPRTEGNESSNIGYPYRVLVDFQAGRFTYCKVSGRPGEGSLVRKHPVTVPAACGGDG